MPISPSVSADSFIYNSYNNHGIVGLINMPSARFFNEGAVGITAYDGNPDQKLQWLHLLMIGLKHLFYTNIQGKPYPGYEYQDYKDKGFNLKIRLKRRFQH